MDTHLQGNLSVALQEKKLNKIAYGEIQRWLTDKEFVEFLPVLTKKIEDGAWGNLMDAFYRTVMFGTGGIRGVMDIGTNRINNYTVRWASQAYAQYLLSHKSALVGKGVAIAYDSRLNSEQFMKETARVLSANGIPVHIFKYYRSHARTFFRCSLFGASGGIVITASQTAGVQWLQSL